MEPLFEAKALFENEYALYHIYRLETEKYKAQLIPGESDNGSTAAPAELILSKNDGNWHIHDAAFKDLGLTLGVEIDVFNHGYGDILGRIGIE